MSTIHILKIIFKVSIQNNFIYNCHCTLLTFASWHQDDGDIPLQAIC